MHRFSSFNNPAYLFSVRETRRVALERDGDVHAARFCAGCHDPVVFFCGKFDDPEFDDEQDPAGQAGITCTVCHAITHVNSVRGNSDYTIDEPIHYPFAFSENGALKLAQPAAGEGQARVPQEDLPEAAPRDGRVLRHLPQGAPAAGAQPLQVATRPEPLRRLPAVGCFRARRHELLLSDRRRPTTAPSCHMPLLESDQFAARDFDGSRRAQAVHDHQFPSANTAIPHLLGMPP